MNEITPELIAEIATRLYNEIPGANMVPKTETDVQQTVPLAEGSLTGAPDIPAGGTEPPAVPETGLDVPGVPNPKGQAPGGVSMPGVGTDPPDSVDVPSPKGVATDGASMPDVTANSPGSVGMPVDAAPPADGVKDFVKIIRSASYRPDLGLLNAPGFGLDWRGVPSLKASASNSVSMPGVATNPPDGVSIPSPKAFTPDGVSIPGVAANPPDGLSAFVKEIRTAQYRPDAGQSAGGLEHDRIQSIFTGKSAPVYGARPLDVPAIRRDFPALNQRVHGKPLAWMDNAATTQKPQSVIDALSRFYACDNSNIHRGAHTLAARATDAYEQARQKVQGFLGASSAKEIIFVRGTTEGVNLVAQSYGRKFLLPGDEIILSTLEHHANIVPWQMVAKEKGAVLRIIPVNDRGEIMMEHYEALLGPRTRLVALTQASNSLGTILPVAEMTQMAKRYGARVLIDGAQSVSHMPVNVQQIGCDFFVFSGHKIFAPTGIGVVYAKEELLEIMPPWQGGGNMIKNVTFEETTYNDPPAKFEAGTPSIADAVGLGAALDYVNRLGLANTGKYEQELLQYATEQLSLINGLRMIGTAREKVAVISFVLHDRPTEEVGRLLDLEGIAVRAGHHCAQPSLRRFGVEATVRPSFSFYNTYDEIDRLVIAVRRILRI